MAMTLLMIGCQSTPQKAAYSSGPSALIAAKKSFASGDLYLAKRQTELFLKENPSSSEGQQLMGEILNEEIAQHKEAFSEEESEDSKKAEIKTLMERSRSLMELGEYDEATRMAETVFTYDPENKEASRLLDQIKQRAWTAGKKEIMDGQEIVRAEVDDRASIYRNQAQSYLEDGQLGAAQMSVQKLLLLYPEDKEGLKIHDVIKSKQRSAAASAKV